MTSHRRNSELQDNRHSQGQGARMQGSLEVNRSLEEANICAECRSEGLWFSERAWGLGKPTLTWCARTLTSLFSCLSLSLLTCKMRLMIALCSAIIRVPPRKSHVTCLARSRGSVDPSPESSRRPPANPHTKSCLSL